MGRPGSPEIDTTRHRASHGLSTTGTHMTKRLTGLALAVGLCIPLIAAPASAATPTDLYVNNNTRGVTCSDKGPGTEPQPFCTLAAATTVAVPGQTITVTGSYTEPLVITRSGTPDQPITITAGPATAVLAGPTSGITVDGQHDVVISRFRAAAGARTSSPVTVTNAARITLDRVVVQNGSYNTLSAGAAIQLVGVTDSSVVGGSVTGAFDAGITLDAASSGVVVKQTNEALNSGIGAKNVEVLGPHNTIVDNYLSGATAVALTIGPAATDTVVANNSITNSRGIGILNAGATRTAITNNTVQNNCGTGIRVEGGSASVSVQNNISANNASASINACFQPPGDGVNIGLYGDAAAGTIVDYNLVFNTTGNSANPNYAVDTPLSLADFRAATGQAAHDLVGFGFNSSVDSANSAAPGWQSTDLKGHPRIDDPTNANKGVGPISYVDRGAVERVGVPAARLTVTAVPSGGRIRVVADASASSAWAPLAITSYTFDFGDGTVVTQSTSLVGHTYRTFGVNHPVTVTVADELGGSSWAMVSTWTYPALPRAATGPRTTVSPPVRR